MGVDRRGELIGWKSYLFMFANVCKARSRPVGAMERDGAGGHVLGVGVRSQQAFCRSVYTPTLLATNVLPEIGTAIEPENIPQHETVLTSEK